jgi:hypothetical protein
VEVRMSGIQVAKWEEAPGYTPVRAEMRALARYWVKKKLDHEFGDIAFAAGRLAALVEAAGEDLVNEATEQVNEELRGGSDHFRDRVSLTDPLVPGYTLTREEVRVLARFWAERKLGLRAFLFAYGPNFSSTDVREDAFAEGRLGALAEAAGEDLVNEATEEVKAEKREWWSGYFWDCFERDYLGAS